MPICQDLAAHRPLFHCKTVSFECERHALHAAALQTCGVAFEDVRSHIVYFFNFLGRKMNLVLVPISDAQFRSGPRRALYLTLHSSAS